MTEGRQCRHPDLDNYLAHSSLIRALQARHMGVFRIKHGEGTGQQGNTGVGFIALRVEPYITRGVIWTGWNEGGTRSDMHPLSPCEDVLDIDVALVGFVARTVEGARFVGGDIGVEVIAEDDVPSVGDVGSGMGEKAEGPLPERPGAIAPPMIKRGNDHAVTPE